MQPQLNRTVGAHNYSANSWSSHSYSWCVHRDAIGALKDLQSVLTQLQLVKPKRVLRCRISQHIRISQHLQFIEFQRVQTDAESIIQTQKIVDSRHHVGVVAQNGCRMERHVSPTVKRHLLLSEEQFIGT